MLLSDKFSVSICVCLFDCLIVLRVCDRSIRSIDRSSLLGETVFAPPDHLVRPLKLWNKIKEVGETVTNDQLRVIARSLGYDTRGLGGFFSGPDASLVRLGNEKIGLREWASGEVDKYKEWLDSQ